MNVIELAKTLKGKPLAPAYVIYGSESFLRGEALSAIRKAADAESAESDITDLDGAKLEVSALFDDLRTASLFASFRLFVVERAESFLVKETKRILAYAEHPAAKACLVLVAESLDKRTKYVQTLLRELPSVECRPMSARAIPSWCLARARGIGKPMDPAAARLMVELAGTNLGQLDGQIQSLATLSSDRPRITQKDVLDLVGGDHRRRIWDLLDAVLDRSPAKAIKALDRLLREPRQSPTGIVFVIAREFRAILQVKLLTENGRAPRQIQERLRKRDWQIRRAIDRSRGLTAAELRQKLALLLKADLDSKTLPSRERPWILERLVLQLCGLQAQASSTRR